MQRSTHTTPRDSKSSQRISIAADHHQLHKPHACVCVAGLPKPKPATTRNRCSSTRNTTSSTAHRLHLAHSKHRQESHMTAPHAQRSCATQHTHRPALQYPSRHNASPPCVHNSPLTRAPHAGKVRDTAVLQEERHTLHTTPKHTAASLSPTPPHPQPLSHTSPAAAGSHCTHQAPAQHTQAAAAARAATPAAPACPAANRPSAAPH